MCVAVYKLASCGEYRAVAKAFGISITSVHRCLYLFCEAMSERKCHHIEWYTTEDAINIATRTEAKSKYPQSIGAIDGSHIAITPPADGYADFICRKQYPSIVLQAVVDCNLKFRDTYANTPGSAHDAAVWRRSPLFQTINRNMPKNDRVIEGVNIPLHILGDPAYPLSPAIIKGYVGRNLTPTQESFNVYHSSARMCVEIAFGRLKSRWRILKKRMDVDFRFAPEIITTCCMLHNICEDNGLGVPLDAAVAADAGPFPQPDQPADRHVDNEAKNIREALTRFIANYPLRRSFHLH